MPSRHQQGTQVGVTDTELTVRVRGLGDLLGREVSEADRDVHRSDDELAELAEPLNVESVVVSQEFQQVDAGEVARGVVEMEVLRAWVAGRDSPGLRTRVPVVDCAVVLNARVGALPRGLGHLAEKLSCVYLGERL